MSLVVDNFERCNQMVQRFESSLINPNSAKDKKLRTGVDLGTAYIVIAVLDEDGEPVCGASRYASVVRDGLVVDYIGAVRIVKELKQEIEKKIGVELIHASAAIPPGTDLNDNGAVKHVLQSAGFEVDQIVDEPTAANSVLGVKNGAVVDVGGGTTGIAIFQDGKVVYTGDEATGGTQFSLVVAGNYKISFEEAEQMKKDKDRQGELVPILKPVIHKVASIIQTHMKGYDIQHVYLVGGTCCLPQMETIIQQELNITTSKPVNPFYVTPLGIALNCKAI